MSTLEAGFVSFLDPNDTPVVLPCLTSNRTIHAVSDQEQGIASQAVKDTDHSRLPVVEIIVSPWIPLRRYIPIAEESLS